MARSSSHRSSSSSKRSRRSKRSRSRSRSRSDSRSRSPKRSSDSPRRPKRSRLSGSSSRHSRSNGSSKKSSLAFKMNSASNISKPAFNAFEQFSANAQLEKPAALDPEQQKRLERLQAWKQKQKDGSSETTSEKTQAAQAPDEVDPLDAYMQTLMKESPAKEKKLARAEKEDERYFGNAEVYSEDDLEGMAEEEMTWAKQREKRFKKKEIKLVDHSKINYAPFRRNLYVEAKEIRDMTDEEVNNYRTNELENVKIRGKDCPRPIMRWTQCGLSQKIMSVLQKHNFVKPFPIQAQAIPVIMSGRDALCCAKTGSGKTLAFVLPMLRHILDQPPLEEGDGPIGLILAPTRELAIQIHADVKKFAKCVGLRSVCCYGGTGVAEQIAQLKRGAEVIVATPGRLIDMLCANQGRVTNLRRVTFAVLDEADRMFDMGFGPQISAIIVNTRPDRQTVMFSATFPKQIEGLAKKALTKPVEIVIGGRSVATNTVTQFVEVIQPEAKFRRLLKLIGEWYDKGNILIFVDRQEAVDNLFSELMRSGYLCLALHGGMDQSDRDYTILDFKKKVRTLMVATSVAARGLDVKDLRLVVNFIVPNHYEDYVHRVGRTGRAGTKGTAYTFISPDEERFAPDLVKALIASKQKVPAELQALSDSFEKKKESGEVQFGANSGYRTGKGFKFDEEEAKKKFKEQQRQRHTYGLEEDKEEAMEEEALAAEEARTRAQETEVPSDSIADQIQQLKAGVRSAEEKSESKMSALELAQQKAKLMALKMRLGSSGDAQGVDGDEEEYCCDELEINDYPQQARWKVTSKGSLDHVLDMIDVAVTTRGNFIPEGRKPAAGERKLHLLIEGKSKMSVQQAKKEIRRLLEEAAAAAQPDDNAYSRYSVL